MKRFYFLLTFSLLLGGCNLTKKEEKIDFSNVVIPESEHEYFEIEYMNINWEDILIQNMDIYYVYIYSTTCNHCRELKNWIIDQALIREDIFFVKGSNKDIIKTDVSSTIGVTDINDIAILGYPSMLKIVNYTLVKNVAGNSKIIDLLK